MGWIGDDMKPLKEKVSITLDGDVIEAIKAQADMQERSFSQYINLVLKKHLMTLERKKQDET